MNMGRKAHIKYTNVVYIMEIDLDCYYIGCVKGPVTPNAIYYHSGNPLKNALNKGRISNEEYFARVRLQGFKECDTLEEAEELEAVLIRLFQILYKEKCLNIQRGNMYKEAGDELRRRMAEGARLSWQDPIKTAQRKQKMSEAKRGYEFGQWYNNGEVNIRRREMPTSGNWTKGQLRYKSN